MWKFLDIIMKIIFGILVFIFIVIPITCSITDSLNKNKTIDECSTKVENIRFSMFGFENNEFDSITVKEYNKDTLLDSFKVFVFPIDKFDTSKKERTIIFNKTININHKYLFIIPGESPYELANMKTEVMQERSMTENVYLCNLSEYTINGERFERWSPCFVKRNFRNVK